MIPNIFNNSESFMQTAHFPVVGIGASAGGLEAFRTLFTSIAPDSGMAYVVIQHLDSSYESNLARLLSKSTSMPVETARNGMEVERNTVYVIPPDGYLLLEENVFTIRPREHDKESLFHPIDAFFTSLSKSRGSNGIGVILTGMGSDGTEGIKSLKKNGGMTIAQDVYEARYDSMPMAALHTGSIDFVMPLAQIGKALPEILEQPGPFERFRPEKGQFGLDNEELWGILDFIRSSQKFDFSEYRRSTLTRRITRRMGLKRISSPREYLDYLRKHPDEVLALKEDLLIKTTEFFRNKELFHVLGESIFPEIIGNKDGKQPIRCWVPGCSTGEEVYSLAISLLLHLEKAEQSNPIQIFGTDVSTKALQMARKGHYPKESMKNVPEDIRDRFFVFQEEHWVIKKEVRDLCVFAEHDFTADVPFSQIDLIICRNVFIYLSEHLQERALTLFSHALDGSGYLVLGGSEDIRRNNLFVPQNSKWKIYSPRTRKPEVDFRQYSLHESRNQTHHGVRRGNTGRAIQKNAEKLLLRRFAPPAVVVNQHLEIQDYLRGIPSHILEPRGRAGIDLSRMVKTSLSVELRNLVQESLKLGKPRHKSGLWVQSEEGSRHIEVEAIPFTPHSGSETHILIIFQETAIEKQAVPQPLPQRETADLAEMERLRLELASTREQFEDLLEEHEEAQEKLQSYNEEIIASNEELQSMNEELTISKEEVEASNEELQSLNDELRSRNNELYNLSNDLQNIITSVRIPLVLVDRDYRIHRFSKAAEGGLGIGRDDLGTSILDKKRIAGTKGMAEMLSDALEAVSPSEREVLLGDRWYSLYVRPYTTMENRIEGAVIVLIDIDRAKKAIEEVENARAFNQSIVDTIKEALVVLDEDLRIVSANPTFCQLFKVTEAEVTDCPMFELGTGQWDIPELRKLLEDILPYNNSVDNYRVDTNFPHLGQRTMYVSARKMRWKNKSKETVLLSINDVTDLEQIEELRRAKLAAEAANKAKSEFLANMSHEIRTPLSGIMGISELLLSQEIPGSMHEEVGMIRDSARMLLRIIEDILDLSRIEARKLMLVPHEFRLPQYLNKLEKQFREQAQSTGLNFSMDIDPRVPGRIIADSGRLGQVLSNLVTNAIKFTRKGSVSVQVAWKGQNQAGPVIQFAVKDTGIGIPQERFHDIFQNFQQLDFSYSKKFGGTGLGLAISRQLVEMMGGEIWVESIPEDGSVFSFTIQAEEPKKATPQNGELGEESPLPALPGLKVLLAEDNKVNQLYLKRLLERAGHEIHAVGNGVEVLEYLRRDAFDLVLMDVQMPVMDGLEATKTIRRDRSGDFDPFIPVIALTAYAMKGDREKFIREGMDGYISKPVDFDELTREIRRVIRSDGGSNRSGSAGPGSNQSLSQ